MSVVSIDNIPIPVPTTEAQIEMIVERLGDMGLNAIADAMDNDEDHAQVELGSLLGNSQGIPT